MQKARLEYDNMRLNRVCDECFIIISNREVDGEGADCRDTQVSYVVIMDTSVPNSYIIM